VLRCPRRRRRRVPPPLLGARDRRSTSWGRREGEREREREITCVVPLGFGECEGRVCVCSRECRIESVSARVILNFFEKVI